MRQQPDRAAQLTARLMHAFLRVAHDDALSATELTEGVAGFIERLRKADPKLAPLLDPVLEDVVTSGIAA